MDDVLLTWGTDRLEPRDLARFFVDWPAPLSLDERLAILSAASEVVIARDPGGRVIGFATALTVGRFSAYWAVSLLDRRPARAA